MEELLAKEDTSRSQRSEREKRGRKNPNAKERVQKLRSALFFLKTLLGPPSKKGEGGSVLSTLKDPGATVSLSLVGGERDFDLRMAEMRAMRDFVRDLTLPKLRATKMALQEELAFAVHKWFVSKNALRENMDEGVADVGDRISHFLVFRHHSFSLHKQRALRDRGENEKVFLMYHDKPPTDAKEQHPKISRSSKKRQQQRKGLPSDSSKGGQKMAATPQQDLPESYLYYGAWNLLDGCVFALKRPGEGRREEEYEKKHMTVLAYLGAVQLAERVEEQLSAMQSVRAMLGSQEEGGTRHKGMSLLIRSWGTGHSSSVEFVQIWRNRAVLVSFMNIYI